MIPFKTLAGPAMALAALALSSAVSAQTVLTMSSWVPPTHTLTEGQRDWCALLEQKVPGKIKVLSDREKLCMQKLQALY